MRDQPELTEDCIYARPRNDSLRGDEGLDQGSLAGAWVTHSPQPTGRRCRPACLGPRGTTAPQLRKKCAKANASPPPEAAEMRDFQAVFGAFGGGKGQGGGSPEDFRSFFRRFYGLIWVSQKKAARPVLKLRAAVAGAFGRPAAHGWLLHAVGQNRVSIYV